MQLVRLLSIITTMTNHSDITSIGPSKKLKKKPQALGQLILYPQNMSQPKKKVLPDAIYLVNTSSKYNHQCSHFREYWLKKM